MTSLRFMIAPVEHTDAEERDMLHATTCRLGGDEGRNSPVNLVGRLRHLTDEMTDLQERILAKGWALLPLRLMVGFGFAAHGYAKLSRGPESFAGILRSLGVPEPHLMAWVTSLLEFLGGISVMAGAFVVPLSLPLVVVMLTAMFGVHFQYGFSSIRLKAVTPSGAEFGPIGYELNVLYIAGLLTLALGRSGTLSVDHYLRTRRQHPNA
jgi:putative oxidoreductase